MGNSSTQKHSLTKQKMVQEVKTKAEFDNVIANASGLVVVDFTATWCGPCQRIKPKVHELAEQNTDVVFVAVDVDDNSDVAGAYNISSMPTFVFIKGGQEVDRFSGANAEKLVSTITAHK
eukprot:c9277_g1_i1.p2 GENE.c9277_g1_i1~~c9277_g1_i1.p2  ORF type:complete len:120 (-),score=26.24 c9277_g1_i1:89-448(-)